MFNEMSFNGASVNSSTITGYGSSLMLAAYLYQLIMTNTPVLNLNNRSWTFEAWIYP